MHDLRPETAIRRLFVDATSTPPRPFSMQPLEDWGFTFHMPDKPGRLGTWTGPSGARVPTAAIARIIGLESATIFRWQIAAIHYATAPAPPQPTPPPPPHLRTLIICADVPTLPAKDPS